MTITLTRRVFLSPCPLCPLQEACEGHEEHDGFRFGEEYVVWLKLPDTTSAPAKEALE